MTALPMLGNLAWAPLPAVDNVDVYDRFNGVPTLGLYSSGGDRELFWRALGYVPRNMSIWLYLPATEEDVSRLSCADSSDVLDGIVFRSQTARYATVGIAMDYRLVFEREWQLPVDVTASKLFDELLDFLAEALRIALEQELPAARREIVLNASEAVRQLAAG